MGDTAAGPTCSDCKKFFACEKEFLDGKDVADCQEFKSRYIEFPITVNKIELDSKPGVDQSEHFGYKSNTLVSIRPCASEYEKKTYLGIYLGDIDVGLNASFVEETGTIKVHRYMNPAIFVPELGKTIFGCESWWGEIESEEQLKQITDEDIQNIWYVKLLKAQLEEQCKKE
jgi:hypothetical protein